MGGKVQIKVVEIHNSPEHNLILAQSHFIKTVEDVHELMVNCVPKAQFGLAFNEASGPKLVRTSGTDTKLVKEATRIARSIGAGHLLVLVMREIYPVNVLPRLRHVPEIVTLWCATANPIQVVVAQTEQGRGVLGVIDGGAVKGVETQDQANERQQFLRTIGYKLG